MNNQKIKHLLLSCSLVLLSLLAGCDNTDYKTRIQKENDRNNPNGNRAICLYVNDLESDMYPYTIHYLEGEISPPKIPLKKFLQHKAILALAKV